MADLWLRIIVRVLLVGALAVRRREWAAVGTLATVSIQDVSRPKVRRPWIRHAQIMATRSGLLGGGNHDRSQAPNLFAHALGLASTLPPLSADLDPADERYYDSIAQFDFLAAMAVIAAEKSVDTFHWYPNFSLVDAERVEPAAVLLLRDQNARASLFPLDDKDLATALRELDAKARSEASWASFWGGWSSTTVKELFERHPIVTP